MQDTHVKEKRNTSYLASSNLKVDLLSHATLSPELVLFLQHRSVVTVKDELNYTGTNNGFMWNEKNTTRKLA